jgi:hypothetical protein
VSASAALRAGLARPPTSRSPTAAIWVVAGTLVGALLLHDHGRSDAALSAHAMSEGAAMVAAMMMVLAAPSAEVVAQASLRVRWKRSVAGHLAGFTMVWFAYGILAVVIVTLLRRVIDPWVVIAVLATVAAVWQLSGTRGRYVDRCSRVRLAPVTGWRADVGTTVGGMHQAARCVTTCWASMLLMAATRHPVAMAALLVVNLSEWAPGPNPFNHARRRRPAAAYLALAVVLVTRGALSLRA